MKIEIICSTCGWKNKRGREYCAMCHNPLSGRYKRGISFQYDRAKKQSRTVFVISIILLGLLFLYRSGILKLW